MLILLALMAAPPEVVATTLDGSQTEGLLGSLSQTAIVVGEAEPIGVDQLQSVEFPDTRRQPIADRPLVVQLACGSVIAAEAVGRNGDVTVTADGTTPFAVKSRHVRAIRFQVLDESLRQAWGELVDGDRRDDLLVVRKGDALDFIACTIGSIDEAAIAIRVGSRDATVPLAKAFGVVLADAEPSRERSAASVSLADGSRLVVESLDLEGETLSLPLCDTDAVWMASLDGVAEIDFAQGRVARLATLEPKTEYRRADRIFDGRRPVRVGQNILNLPPQIKGRTDPSSVWMHSGTTATYRLPRGAVRFQAEAGIDEIEGADVPAGGVDVTVRGDGTELWTGPIEPDRMTSWDLVLDDVRQMSIEVEGRTPDGIREHLVLFGARIITE